jgi:acetyl-CoA acetyltransferase
MTDVVIIDAIRTPVGALGGSLASVRPDDLAALVIRTIVERTGLDPALVEEVYLGCANQAGEDNRNVARMALLLAGLPVEVAGVTFNRLCASGLTAVNMAARAIRAGEGDIFIAGGVESMSRAPYSLPKGRERLCLWQPDRLGYRPGLALPQPKDGRAVRHRAMGETAENIAEMTGITREEQDRFRLRSHQRASPPSIRAGLPRRSCRCLCRRKKGDPLLVTTDERPRRDTSLESLAACGLPSARTAASPPATPRAERRRGGPAADERRARRAAGPEAAGAHRRLGRGGRSAAHHGHGAGPGSRKALARAGLPWIRSAWWRSTRPSPCSPGGDARAGTGPEEITNVNGGAIALGHPLGCSGARILTTLLHELKRCGRSAGTRPLLWPGHAVRRASGRAKPPWSNGWA